MTALDWYYEQTVIQGKTNYYELHEKAKEIEKKQMHKCASFWRGKENEIEIQIFEQYYNETYGSKGSETK